MQRLSVLAIGLCLVAGCQDSVSPGPATVGESGSDDAGKTVYRIAVIPKGTTHQFYKSVHAGAVNAAKELGNVDVFWKGPLHENDRDGQISVVQDFVTKGVDGICLAPLDSQALIEYVVEATEEGIPVVVFDSGIDDESHIVSYIASDNYNGGVLAARHMGKLLDGKGNVIVLRYAPGSDSTTQREDGFAETLKKEFPDIVILTSTEYSGTTSELALDKATQLFAKYKDQVDGIFAACEPNATGVLGALRESELVGKVKFVCFDPSSELIACLEKGTVHGIVLQDPVAMGYQSVVIIVKHLRGKSVQKRIGTGEYVAIPENMNTPDIQRLLRPQQHEN